MTLLVVGWSLVAACSRPAIEAEAISFEVPSDTFAGDLGVHECAKNL